jgi:hypothetical protein
MEKLWKSIKKDVQNRKWDTNGLQEMIDKQLDVILVKELINFDADKKNISTISKNGDIVVGFYLDENNCNDCKLLQLDIGGDLLPNLVIEPGEFVYVFENTHIYPIIASSYSKLHVITPSCNGLYVIYALINDSEVRRSLATSTNVLRFVSGKNAIIRGFFGYIKENLNDHLKKYTDRNNKYIDIPNMKNLF